MATRRITRFRPRRSPEDGASPWGARMLPLGAGLMLAAGLAFAWLLYQAPRTWAANAAEDLRSAWTTEHWAGMVEVERHWQSLPPLPRFQVGDEPAVQAYLRLQPLVTALLDRRAPERLWVREGDRLRPGGEGARAALDLAWIWRAGAASIHQWNPPRDLDPEAGRVASVVLMGDEWAVIKRWRPGAPEVERALRLALGPASSMRVGLIRSDLVERAGLPHEPWGAEPGLQADPGRLAGRLISLPTKSTAFGEGWDPVGIPFEAEAAALGRSVRTQLWGARATAALVGLAMLAGLWLRHRARQRAVLAADRLASLTHSLKTPLAVLKFRCDSLRLGRLGTEEAEAELLKLGTEVDDLTRLIEHGLTAIRGGGATSPEGEVGPAWIAEVVQDLQPVFAAERRAVDLRLTGEAGRAALASLRPALQTLIENALFHGQGTVAVETWRSRKRLLLRVSDEGRGLDAAQLEALGRPFLRVRAAGGEGFRREGQGLGLSLLFQVAEQEGWGLSLSSAPGAGFSATLELRAGAGAP